MNSLSPIATALPPEATARLRELLPASWSFTQVQRVVDWAGVLVVEARAEEHARIHASLRSSSATVAVAPRPVAATPDSVPAVGSPWSEAEKQTLMQMAGAGATAAAIAEALSRPEGAIAFRLAQLRRRGALPPAAPPKGNFWSAQDNQTLLRLVAAGERSSAIATAMGRTPRAVEQRLLRLRQSGVAVPARPARGGTVKAARPVASPKPAAPLAVASPMAARQPALPKTQPAPVKAQPDLPEPQPAPAKAQPAPVSRPQDAAAMAHWASRIAADISAAPKPIVQRAMAHLHRLPAAPGFDPVADLMMLVETACGVPSAVLADQLGVSARDVGLRFRAMLPAELRDRDGRLSIGGRLVLLEAAKRNALALA